jgi:hypothetical protein
MNAIGQLQKEIDKRTRELAALKKALSALKNISGGSGGSSSGKGNRTPRTPEQKAKLSRALKAAWKKRKAAEKAEG